MHGEPIVARPTGAVERLLKWTRRRPTTAALVTVSAAAVILLVSGLLYSNASIRTEHQLTNQALLREQDESAKRATAEATALEALRNEKSASYANRVGLAHAEWRDNHLSLATRLLDKCPADLRGWEWYYVNRLCRSTATHPALLGLCRSLQPGRPVHRHRLDGWSQQPNAVRARVWDAVTGKLLFVLKGLTNPIGFATFSADGRYLATAHHDVTVSGIPGGEVKVWEIATEKAIFSLPSNRPVKCLALSPDGQSLYLDIHEDEKTDVRVYSVADGKRLPSPVPPPTAGPFALSRDGKHLAMLDSSVNTDRLMICDALTGKKLAACSMQGLVGSVFQVAFSPDGRRLGAVCGWQAVVWDAPTGKRLYAIEHGPDLRRLAFSPDGQTLALAIKSDVKIIAAESGRELFTLRTGYPREITGIAFHPDGTRLATSGIPGESVKVSGDR